MSTNEFDVVVIGAGIVGCYLAARLAEAGSRVALVECGPREIGRQRPANPPLEIVGRENKGARAARNQVLGGNANYWGGGLIDNPRDSSSECLAGVDGALIPQVDDAERLAALETRIGILPGTLGDVLPRRSVAVGVQHARMLALMGKSRNVAARLLRAGPRKPACELYADADVAALDVSDGHLRAISVASPLRGNVSLAAKEFILAAGVIDSNVFAQRFARELGIRAVDRLGRALHDHWSVPIFDALPADARVARSFAPRFLRGNLVVSRWELHARGGWPARGFVHLQFQFDAHSPYREIKNLLAARQAGAGVGVFAKAAIDLAGCVPSLVSLGLDRLLDRPVTVGSDLPLTGNLDFESYPSPENAIEWVRDAPQGESARLRWNIHAEDAEAFENLVGQWRTLCPEVLDPAKLRISERLAGVAGEGGDYLDRVATDAFHLGGGLAVGAAPDRSVLDPLLRFHGTRNLAVVSTAVFARPGVANPVLTLLEIAERLAGRIGAQPKAGCTHDTR